MKGLSLFSVAAFSLALASCGGSSYPKDQLPQRLAEVCKREYGLTVRAQVAGSTLGVLVELPGLVDELRKSASADERALMDSPPLSVEGRYTEGAFDFRVEVKAPFKLKHPGLEDDPDDGKKEPSDVMKKLRRVSHIVLRACLSTDAKIDFYTIIARDPGSEKYDLIFSGHVMDTKMMQYYAISMGEFRRRSEYSVRRQPEALAAEIVEAFLIDLRRRSVPELLSAYTARSKRFEAMLPKMIDVATIVQGNEQSLFDQPWHSRQIDEKTVLVAVPLKPLADPGTLLFVVEVKEGMGNPREMPGALLDILRLSNRELLPEVYQKYGSPETWKDSFYLEPLSLPIFIAKQVARRVMASAQPIPDQKEEAELKKLPKDLQKMKRLIKKNQPAPAKNLFPPGAATLQDLAEWVTSDLAYSTKIYQFDQYREMSLVDVEKGTRWQVPAAQVKLFRERNHPNISPVP